MSCLGFSKTTKPWRKLTTAVGTKLSKIKRSKSLGRLAAGLDTVVRRRRRLRRSARSTYRVCVDRVQTARPSTACFAPVYVDELYSSRQQPVQVQMQVQVEEKKKKATDMHAAAASSSSSITSGGDGAEEGMVMISGVDLRAEIFIRKFKEEKKLERQRSFQEYQEMLARGV